MKKSKNKKYQSYSILLLIVCLNIKTGFSQDNLRSLLDTVRFDYEYVGVYQSNEKTSDPGLYICSNIKSNSLTSLDSISTDDLLVLMKESLEISWKVDLLLSHLTHQDRSAFYVFVKSYDDWNEFHWGSRLEFWKKELEDWDYVYRSDNCFEIKNPFSQRRL